MESEYIGIGYLVSMIVLVLWAGNWARRKDEKGRK